MKKFRFLSVLLLLFAFLGIPYQRVFACSCNGPLKADKAMQQFDAIFVGRAVALDKNPTPVSSRIPDDTLVTLYASTVWKGTSQPKYVISTNLNGTSCGVGFEIGRDYLVYASKGDKSLTTGLCYGTQEVGGASQQISELGKNTVALDNSHPVWLPLLVVARDNTPYWNCRRDKVCARMTFYACQVMGATMRAQLFCR